MYECTHRRQCILDDHHVRRLSTIVETDYFASDRALIFPLPTMELLLINADNFATETF